MRTRRKAKKKKGGFGGLIMALGVVVALCGVVFHLNTSEQGSDVIANGKKLVETVLSKPAAPKSSPTKPGPAKTTVAQSSGSQDTILIYSFNIQIFGASKMKKPEVVDILVDIVSKADLIAIQEVRSGTDAPVLDFMARLPDKYSYVLGPREGRSSSKEQYWVIYDTTKLQVLKEQTWSDPDDIFERNPLAVFFKTSDNFDFILIDNHIQPSGAAHEIAALPEVVRYFRNLWDEADVLVMGDFNADGSYYNESLLESVFPPSDYTIVIGNELDTTVAVSDNTYDRFIITKSAREDYAGNCGVIRFDELYDFTQLSIEPRHISDHFPIWAEFKISADTD
jgi:endonuclease/exonuclease/phosphatase family metal-dependent hydrolase